MFAGFGCGAGGVCLRGHGSSVLCRAGIACLPGVVVCIRRGRRPYKNTRPCGVKIKDRCRQAVWGSCLPGHGFIKKVRGYLLV